MSFEGKVAIVTGAGKGIGRSTALALARSGAKVVLAGYREESIGQVKEEILPINNDVMTVKADVASWEDTQALAAAAREKFGRIDLLVNNAGRDIIYEDGRMHSAFDLDNKEWNLILNVNLKGQYHCAKAVAPTMIEQKFGRIVNLSSTTGISGTIASIAYCAAKAGIMTMTKTMAAELGPHNICVNCVAPGLTMTAMQEHTPAEMIAMIEKRLPLRRAGQPIDIARTILFFLAEDQFSTGQTLVVDGGGTMH